MPDPSIQYVCQQHRCSDHRDQKDAECDHKGCVLTPYEPWMEGYSTLTVVGAKPHGGDETPERPDA
jgi:hypothetical protein